MTNTRGWVLAKTQYNTIGTARPWGRGNGGIWNKPKPHQTQESSLAPQHVLHSSNAWLVCFLLTHDSEFIQNWRNTQSDSAWSTWTIHALTDAAVVFSQVTLKQLCQNGTGWNESNAGTLPLLVIVTYNSQWPSAQHYKRLVFQTWVPVSWITNEISLNALGRSHGVFLEEAVKRIVNRLSETRKIQEDLYNLGKSRYKWHLSIYLQIYLQSYHHNFKTVFNKNVVSGGIFPFLYFWDLSLQSSNIFMFQEWVGLFSNLNASGNVNGLGVFYSRNIQSLKLLSNYHKSKAEVIINYWSEVIINYWSAYIDLI